MPQPFGTRLHSAMHERGPLCVGIDPHASLLQQWGLPDSADGLAAFTDTVVNALAGQVAVLKPQIAFYERFGSPGLAVLERAIPTAREAGALVIMDAKRGDIGSTMSAYAQAYLHPQAPLFSDALTISPFLGVGSLQPAFDLAQQHGGGVFVLAMTSNPEGPQVQQARIGTDEQAPTVASTVLTEVGQRNAAASSHAAGSARGLEVDLGLQPGSSSTRLGSFGVVIGATVPRVDDDLRAMGGPILAPGLGAQGANAADLPRLFAGALNQVLPMYGRSILAAGPETAALQDAAAQAAAQCRAELGY